MRAIIILCDSEAPEEIKLRPFMQPSALQWQFCCAGLKKKGDIFYFLPDNTAPHENEINKYECNSIG